MFLTIFDLRSSIVLMFSIAAYPVCSLLYNMCLLNDNGSHVVLMLCYGESDPFIALDLTLKTPKKMHLKMSSAEVVCCK